MVIYLLFIAGFVASFATCGLALPFALLLYVPAIVGVVHAARGERAGRWALGHLGERLLDVDVNADESATQSTRKETAMKRQEKADRIGEILDDFYPETPIPARSHRCVHPPDRRASVGPDDR